jgi:hypothetical protein
VVHLRKLDAFAREWGMSRAASETDKPDGSLNPRLTTNAIAAPNMAYKKAS